MSSIPEVPAPDVVAEAPRAVVEPAQVLRCPVCGGDGWIETGMDALGVGRGRACRRCDGIGLIATDGGEV